MTATSRWHRVLWVMGLLAACAPEQETPAKASASQTLRVGPARPVFDLDEDAGFRACVSVGSTCFFSTPDAAGGHELWKSDGTEAGTVRVRDIVPGAEGSAPDVLTPMDGTLFFAARSDDGGRELWKSDGTEPGTVRVRDLVPGTEGSDPQQLTPAGGVLYFTARTTGSGRGLWKSDGTEPGTVLVKDFGTQVLGSLVSTAGGPLLFFVGDCLWKSDGTPAGTVPVGNHCPGYPRLSATAGNTVFFGYGPMRGLWRSDGTAEGSAQLLSNLGDAGGDFINVANFAVMGGTVYFRVLPSNELWKSDGTPAGTVRVKTLGATPHSLVAAGDTLFFTTSAGGLWKSDGTEAGTTLVSDRRVGWQHCCSGFAAAGSRLFFTGYGGSHAQLWTSDGTVPGTVPVVDLVPQALSVVGERLFFAAPYANLGMALLVADVSEGGGGHAPVAQPAQVVTDEDVPVALQLSGSDEDGDLLSFSVTQSPEHGTLSGTPPSLTYTPARNYRGTDRLHFQVTDPSGNASEAEVSITVVPGGWGCASGPSAPLVWLLPVMAAWALRRRSSRRPE